MTKPKLTYFDAPASRGEECRLALHIAGVEFEDVRIKPADWPALKPTTPFGSMPLFELPGRPVLAQSNAILGYIGRAHGLLPDDAFDAAHHVALMHIKLYMIVRWFAKGGVDHIPATIFAEHGKLTRLYDAVSAHEGVTSWYAKTTA
jgi:hypothetical protein